MLFLGLARYLGAEGYGSFIALLAVVSFFSPLATCGTPSILVRNVAQKRGDVNSQLRACLAFYLGTMIPLILAASAAALLLLPSPPPFPAIAVLALSEIGASSLVELLARSEQSQHHIGKFGGWTTGLVLMRLLCFSVYTLFANPTAEGWIWAYSAGSVLYSVCLWRYAGSPKPESRSGSISSLVKDGYPFAFASLSNRIQAELNKPILAQLSIAATGNFSAAHRVVDLASLPFIALQEALWPRFFATGKSFQALMLSSILVCSTVAAGGILWWSAPLVAAFLGDGFAETASMLRWLALLPAIQVVRNILGVYHSKVNSTGFITRGYAIGALASILLTPILISKYSVCGAIWAMYITEVTIVALQIPIRRNLGA